MIDGILSPVLAFAERLKLGLETVWYRTGQVTRTFVRSGYVIDDDVAVDQAVNLSMLESAPILGALVSVVARGIDSRPRLRSLRKRLRQPGGATAFALGLYAVLFSLLYLPELPVHAQVTVRYLLPVYIIGVVGLVWCPPLRSALQRHVRTFAWALVAGVLIGGQVLIAAFAGLDLALGEAFQFYALLGLALAAAIAIVSLLTVFTDRTDRLFAAAVGVTGSTVSVFTLLIVTAFASSIGLYPIGGEQLLPIVRVLGDLLTPL